MKKCFLIIVLLLHSATCMPFSFKDYLPSWSDFRCYATPIVIPIIGTYAFMHTRDAMKPYIPTITLASLGVYAFIHLHEDCHTLDGDTEILFKKMAALKKEFTALKEEFTELSQTKK